MDVGAGLYMYDVVAKKFTFAISSPDEFLYKRSPKAAFEQGQFSLCQNVVVPAAPERFSILF